jgi:hypothetical protein
VPGSKDYRMCLVVPTCAVGVENLATTRLSLSFSRAFNTYMHTATHPEAERALVSSARANPFPLVPA